MNRNLWLSIVCLSYILAGVKGFPKDDWSILYIWLGFGGLFAVNHIKRQENQNEQ